MKLTVTTWNINSVRLRIDLVAKFVKAARPDVICLQETKCPDDKFPVKRFGRLGYPHAALNGQKGYHGVAVLSRLPLDSIDVRNYCGKSDSRHLAVRIGVDVFILGYPFGYSPPGFPVWKRGSIASEPDLVHFGPGYHLIDTASRPGMSGAPVILRSWGMHYLEGNAISSDSTPQSKFIGVYSGRLHTREKTDAQIGMVWPVRDIEDIVSMEKRDE